MKVKPQKLLDKGGKLRLSAYFNTLYFHDYLNVDDDIHHKYLLLSEKQIIKFIQMILY